METSPPRTNPTPGPSASSAEPFPRPGAREHVNIYEAQFPGSQENLCLIYSPDFPLEEPSYLFRLFIYCLSPSLPRLHQLPALLGKRLRRLTLRHERAARTVTPRRGPGTDQGWRAGPGHRAGSSAQRRAAAAASPSLASAVSTLLSLRKPAEGAPEPSPANPAQPPARGRLGKPSWTRVSPGCVRHRSVGFAFPRGTAAASPHPPRFIWASLLKHTVRSLGIRRPVPSPSPE